MRIEPIFLFSRWRARGQRLSAFPCLEGGTRWSGHRTVGLAHPQHGHERRPVHQPTVSRDGIEISAERVEMLRTPMLPLIRNGQTTSALCPEPAILTKTPGPIRICFWLPPHGCGRPTVAAVVVGDSIWDMLATVRCRALGVGLSSGGYGPDELRRSGAFRVYEAGRTAAPHRRGRRSALRCRRSAWWYIATG